MKNKSLLIITQTVDQNDSNLGFFCDWVREFAVRLDKVYVIANKVGEYNLPENVEVLSLGKELGKGRMGKVIKLWQYLLKYLPKVDGVFAHMCPEYVVAGGWLARVYGKKLGLWYLHKSLTWKLRLSEKLVNYIFTAHQDGLPIKSNKVIVTGHAIAGVGYSSIVPIEKLDILKILTVGRVSESKNLLILVKSAILLAQKSSKQVKLTVVGESYLDKDREYFNILQEYVEKHNAKNMVEFVGKVPHDNISSYYKQADVFVNASQTGGLDKAVLEAMLMGVPVVTSNQAFINILPKECLFAEDDLNELVEKILNYENINTDELKKYVVENHSTNKTIGKIVEKLL